VKPLPLPYILGSALGALLFSTAALARDSAPLRTVDGVLVNTAGMTVYTYDKDTPDSGKSNCVGPCARNWPPVLAEGAPPPPYSIVTRGDGNKQLAYKGRPLYTFVKDKKAGEKTGDGVGGAWHVVAGD
jgi:predicted lipoprotein with Yx(FWY)xxD motif